MTHSLEAPSGQAPDWDTLYLTRGAEEIVAHRPFFTGDVFTSVPVQPPRGERKIKTVLIIQHPCAMRPEGVTLSSSILVAEVHRFPVLTPDKWATNGKLMPLPELLSDVESNRRNQAAFFDSTYHVHPQDLTNRIACLSLRGVNLLLQRWVYHCSRVIIPSFDFNAVVGPVYEQADLIEEWCDIASSSGRPIDAALYDVHSWLRESDGSLTRERALEDPQRRAQVRRQARAAARTWHAGPSQPGRASEPQAS